MPARRPLRSFCFAFFSGAENKLKSENVSFFIFFLLHSCAHSSISYGLCCWHFLFEPKPGYVSHFSAGVVAVRHVLLGVLVVAGFVSHRRVRRLQCLRTKNLQSTNAAAGLEPKKNAAGTCHYVCRISVPRGLGHEPHLATGR